MGAPNPVREPRRSEHEVRGLAAWLRACRQETGLSQEELADAIGVSRRNYGRWESPSQPTEMGATDLLKFMDAVGVRVNPPPPPEIPRAINAELADLRRTVQILALRLSPSVLDDAIEAVTRLDAGEKPGDRAYLEGMAAAMRLAALQTDRLADRLEEGAQSAEQ